MGKVTSRSVENHEFIIFRVRHQQQKEGYNETRRPIAKDLKRINKAPVQQQETKLQVVFGDLITRNWGDDNFDFREKFNLVSTGQEEE
ncbi:hypothetical protein GOBAR_AA39791 [Gossypium barbadense]|uniref:Uncharacterized protein n=1 Tax=Gossypium barbadense TaxID=3634 RepID=A0A2P5VQ14_GOSBA|nr:hypothetical protein GOBAR_AA39791 [Gossypium barbadense]